MGRTKLDALEVQRQITLSKFELLIKRIETHLENVSDPPTVETCETLLELLESNFESFSKTQNDLMSCDKIDVTGEAYVFDEQQTEYIKAKSKLRSVIKSAQVPRSPSVASVPSSVATLKLPKFELPVFKGKYVEWMSFFDLFRASVDANSSLCGAQKLQYLKTFLNDEPLRLIESLPTTNENYAIALKTLRDRYQNKRVLVREHLQHMFNLPHTKIDSSASIRKLVETVDKNVLSLRTLGLDTKSWDVIIVHFVTERLDTETRKQWEMTSHTESNDALPTYDELKAFLQTRACALEASKQTQPPRQPVKSNSANIANNERSVNKPPCSICKSDSHRVYTCPVFGAMSQADRSAKVRELKLCFNCLSSAHRNRDCKSTIACKNCNQRHHSLLHVDIAQPRVEQTPSITNTNSNVGTSPLDCSDARTLLATALVPVLDKHNNAIDCRALLDNGSETSFITEACAQRLGLKRRKHNAIIKGIGGKVCSKTNGTVELALGRNSGIKVVCAILPKVTRSMPSSFIPVRNWTATDNLKLADPQFNVPAPTDLLLGVDVYDRIVLENKIRDKSGLYLRETLFGWIVSGALKNENALSSLHAYHVVTSEEFDLTRFWQLEEIPATTKLTPDEQACVEHFDRTTTRDATGRFEVKLPFRSNSIPDLDFTLNIAMRRLFSMERRFRSDKTLATEYSAFVQEFIDLGHLEPVPADELVVAPGASCYLPHHGVRKASSTTTKLRVVFDGSASLKDGTSLNTSLLVGPRTQDDLVDIILRFRMHEVAFTADIAKMYRQVALQKPDRDFHRIVWRTDPSSPIQHYRMTRVTYGVASSSYHSTRCINQIADIENHPLASPVLKRDIYVDDLQSGARNIALALEMQKSLVQVLKLAGFELRKWSSNDPSLIAHLPPEMRENSDFTIDSSSHTIKTLGITWNPSSDCFLFVFAPLPPGTVTKRALLSDTARVFDPLGWISPLVISLKILFQKCWVLGLDWDTALPDDVARSWLTLRCSFASLDALRIPRLALCHSVRCVNLHVFCDASESAYAAAAYFVSYDENGNAHSSLLCSKTRVAPTKTTRLPRLELCAAHLGARLAKCIKQAFASTDLEISEIIAWSDSTIVLCWLNDLPRRWVTFVANRVSEIQELIPAASWYHVPTADNPADLASRGCDGDQLINSAIWFNGPTWLTLDRSEWPRSPLIETVDAPEQRKVKVSANVSLIHEPIINICRFSQFSRLVRTFAYVLRFTNNARVKNTKLSGPLVTFEIKYATRFLVRSAQLESLASEYHTLSRKRPLPSSSKLLPLAPFYDPDEMLIRVGGRLKHSSLEYAAKHPILLPRDHYLSTLIVRQAHLDTLHAGSQLTLSRITEQFWIINARDLVRRVIHACGRCARYAQNIKPPFMADLPAARVTPSRPFTHCGLDYAGPFDIKTRTGRGAKHGKAYLALFVCFATKATHLEAVSDMTTDACIAAIRRFVSRRGLPSVLYSDNGKNFVGACNELNALAKLLNSAAHNDALAVFASQNSFVWTFNPPSAPHFGGLWEAGVKGVKTHLRRVVGQTSLTFEELTTVFAQIEACLNSRPLTKLSSDPNDPRPLTPGHFLTGDATLALPQRDLIGANSNRLTRWHLVQKLTQDVWQRWRQEYLATLMARPKWTTGSGSPPSMTVGSVVLLTDHCPPATWPLGVVADTHPGKDGITRVVSVRAKSKLLRRPVHTLRVLPTDDLLNPAVQGGRHVQSELI